MIIYFKGKRHTFLNCFGLFSRQKKIVSSLLSRDPRYRFLRAFTNLTRSTFYLRRSREIKSACGKSKKGSDELPFQGLSSSRLPSLSSFSFASVGRELTDPGDEVGK